MVGRQRSSIAGLNDSLEKVCHKVCQLGPILWVLDVNSHLIHSISNQSH